MHTHGVKASSELYKFRSAKYVHVKSHKFHCSHIAADVDHIVSTCQSCGWNKRKCCHLQKLQMFLASEPLDRVLIKLWDHFSRQHKITNTYRSWPTDPSNRLKQFQRPIHRQSHCKKVLRSLANHLQQPEVHTHWQWYSICRKSLCYDVCPYDC